MFESVLGIKKPIFGLDIGYKSIKLVQIKGTGNGAHLWGAVEASIPEGILRKEGIREKEKLVSAIKQAMAEAKPHPITAKIVSSALPESLVFTKSIDLPKMSQKEINKNVPYQATEFFPIPPAETYMDWQVVGERDNRIEVLVVAAPKLVVSAITEVISMAGLELMGLETKPIAVARALINPRDDNTYLILDIGAKTSGLTCYDQHTIRLTSTTAIGCDNLVNDFGGSVKILASEIMHSIKYYQNRIGQTQMFREIILSGGGANVEKISEVLESLTKIRTEIGQPQIPINNYDPRYATAIGLGLKEI